MNATLITGGAGFIGTNLAHRLLSDGEPVLVFDNLSRPGVDGNLRWLTAVHGNKVEVQIGDVRDASAIARAVAKAGAVFHLAAQTAVTVSMIDPDRDFDVNVRGTLNLLDALRACKTPPPLVFTSTNKVYGDLGGIALHDTGSQYEPADRGLRRDGVSESQPLDFRTPYGCSKGAADQYVLDYARSYGLPSAVFRMSCIYGPHQCGTEDQGWVAHFVRRALEGRPIDIYGDGRQVRDLLYVDDLVDAFLLARANIAAIGGQAFNLGGGVGNAASLLEVLEEIRHLHGECSFRLNDWRPSDQRYYVSNTSKFNAATGWSPRTGIARGLEQLYAWASDQRSEKRRPRRSLDSEPSRPTATTARNPS
jgi:CDP-paratose 2-epimerase